MDPRAGLVDLENRKIFEPQLPSWLVGWLVSWLVS